MLRAYWFYAVYVSPVLLVAVCGFLAWKAFKDSTRMDAEERRAQAGRDAHPPEREAWSTDPDAWKRG